MRQHRFPILVIPEPAVREGPAQRLPDLVHALAGRGCCLIQPACHQEYFPVVIYRDQELPLSRAFPAMMAIALADGEAQAFFKTGQHFTIWADCTVGRTIRADGLAGYGAICGQAAPLPAGLAGHRSRLGAADPDRGHRLAAAGAPTGEGHVDMRLPGWHGTGAVRSSARQ